MYQSVSGMPCYKTIHSPLPQDTSTIHAPRYLSASTRTGETANDPRINFQLRRFFGIAAMIAAVEFSATDCSAKGEAPAPQPSTGRDGATSLAPLSMLK